MVYQILYFGLFNTNLTIVNVKKHAVYNKDVFGFPGRAFDWQSKGQGFDPPKLHHQNPLEFQRFQGFILYII